MKGRNAELKNKIGILTTALVIMLVCTATVEATVTLSPKIPAATEKVVVLVMDDRWLVQYTNALPILQTYGYKTSLAIYPAAQDGEWPDYMSWAQVQELSQSGFDVESHTYTHPHLNQLSAAQLQEEMVKSKT
jgi:peptidoglycan/xylan/chitin deacetylase (PgdA/CDA1 family)